MKRSRHHGKEVVKYHLLLDEGLPPRRKFPKLNGYHNLRHIKHEFGLGGLKDYEVYNKAIEENRILLVFNRKDFKRLVKSNTPSVFCISQDMATIKIDNRVLGILANLKSFQNKGHLIFVSQQNTEIRKVVGRN